MGLEEIYNLFEESSEENFPIKRCIHKHEKYPNFKYSLLWYTCILISSKNKNEFLIKNLRPVIKEDKEGKIFYGWLDEHEFLYDSYNMNSFNQTHEKVVAFKENNYNLEDEFNHKLWER